jgi:hypothetical protein
MAGGSGYGFEVHASLKLSAIYNHWFKIPAQGQNYKLTKYGAKRIKATGMIYKRGSSRTIVLETIEQTTE